MAMPDFDTSLLPSLAAALGLGLLIGAVRERRETRKEIVAGLRTHALTALAGVTALWLGAAAFAVVLALAGGFVAMSYWVSRDHDPGLTGEIALVLTCLLGGLALPQPALAAGLGVLTAVLLYAKQPLQRLTRELLSEREVQDGLLLLASALVILPLLPNRPLGPFGVFNPATLWTLVVLVMAISALGHVALRLVGNRWGLAIAGFFAGYVSSTAAVAGFGERVRETPALLRPAVGAALLANLASLSLFVPILLAVSPSLLRALWPELLVAALVLLGGGLAGLGNGREAPAPPTAEQRMFRFRHALLLALVITAVLFASAALGEWLGPRGAVTAAVLAALAEIHAAMASLAHLQASQRLDVEQARVAVLGLLAASSVAKTLVAIASGGRGYGLRVGIGLAGMTLAASMAWLLRGSAA